jgi:hypothetical protein
MALTQRGQLNWHIPDHAQALSDGVSWSQLVEPIEAAGSLASVIMFRRPHKAGGGLHVHLSLRWFLTSDRANSGEDGILRVGGGAECVEGAASSHNGRS